MQMCEMGKFQLIAVFVKIQIIFWHSFEATLLNSRFHKCVMQFKKTLDKTTDGNF